jgi:uncharacterized LabA/DUF88 family protein
MELLFLVDVANLFHSARSTYGSQARIDFRKLRDAAINGRRFDNILCAAYLTAKEDSVPDNFCSTLQKLGYTVRLMTSVSHEDGTLSGTNVDVRMALDAVTGKVGGVFPSHVCIASGDADFMPVYEQLKARPAVVEVLAFPTSLSAAVEKYADRVEKLDETHLFVKRNSHG